MRSHPAFIPLLALSLLLALPIRCRHDQAVVKERTTTTPRVEKRAYLGILYTESPGGIRIAEVFEGSPAERAGLKIGDFVLSLNGRSIEGRYSMKAFIDSMQPGDVIQLEILRNGQDRIILKAYLQEVPPRPPLSSPSSP